MSGQSKRRYSDPSVKDPNPQQFVCDCLGTIGGYLLITTDDTHPRGRALLWSNEKGRSLLPPGCRRVNVVVTFVLRCSVVIRESQVPIMSKVIKTCNIVKPP